MEFYKHPVTVLVVGVDEARAKRDPLFQSLSTAGNHASDGSNESKDESERAQKLEFLQTACNRVHQVIGTIQASWATSSSESQPAPSSNSGATSKDEQLSIEEARIAQAIGRPKTKPQHAAVAGTALARWQQAFEVSKPPILVVAKKQGYAESLGSIESDEEDEKEGDWEHSAEGSVGSVADDADSIVGVAAGEAGSS